MQGYYVGIMSTGFEKIWRDLQLQYYWIRRVVAFIVDEIIISLCILVVVGIIATPLTLLGVLDGFPWYLFGLFPFSFFLGVLSLLYFVFLETFYGATFGKRIMNLKAAKLDGQSIPLNLAFIRNLSKIQWFFAVIDAAIGLATPGDPHQKVSDRYAGTTVSSTYASPFASIVSRKPTLNHCPNCRGKLPEKALYCPYCGKPLTSTGAEKIPP
jgi:uncharacterized RDD family membrane protein YckC